jgi:ribonuclease BN (tRNA processing enzyme)
MPPTRIASIFLSLAALATAAGQSAPTVASGPAPTRIAVYPGDTIDPRARALAALVRDRLETMTARVEAHVIPLRDLEGINITYSPQPSTHQEFREWARVLRADVVVDVVARASTPPPRARGRAIVHYPSDARPDTVFAEGSTDSALARDLAREIHIRTRTLRRSAERRPPAATPRTRVVMLGTGTPIADPDRFGPSVVVLVDSTPYLFDIGVGVVRRWAGALRNNAAPLGPTALRTAFVTHLHSDHTLGLAELIFTPWTLAQGPAGLPGPSADIRPLRPLHVYGPPGLEAMTTHLLAAYAEDIAERTGAGGDLEGVPAPVVRAHEIAPGVVYRDSLVTVTAFVVHHGTWKYAFGYRIQTPDKVIVLSGDAGPPSTIAEQCQGCDLLLHEGGSILAAEASEYFRRFHTTPEALAEIARAAHPKLLVLYHQRPPTPAVERAYAKLRELYSGPFVVARDLDVFR